MNPTNHMDPIAIGERLAGQNDRVLFLVTAAAFILAAMWAAKYLADKFAESQSELRRQGAENLEESRKINTELMIVIANNTAATMTTKEALHRNSSVLQANSETLRDAQDIIAAMTGTKRFNRPAHQPQGEPISQL